jgi:hypothetical protein
MAVRAPDGHLTRSPVPVLAAVAWRPLGGRSGGSPYGRGRVSPRSAHGKSDLERGAQFHAPANILRALPL